MHTNTAMKLFIKQYIKIKPKTPKDWENWRLARRCQKHLEYKNRTAKERKTKTYYLTEETQHQIHTLAEQEQCKYSHIIARAVAELYKSTINQA